MRKSLILIVLFGVTVQNPPRVEAGAFATPSITSTAAGGASDIIEHEASGLAAPPGDRQALADAMLRLLEDDHLRLRLGREVRSRVFERHTDDRFQRALLGVLQ